MAKQKGKQVKTQTNEYNFFPFLTTDKHFKIPFLKLMSLPFIILIDKFKTFMQLGGIYAMIISLLSLAFGNSYMCSIGVAESEFCFRSYLTWVIYFILQYFILLNFCIMWYQVVFMKKTVRWKDVFDFHKTRLKSMGVLTCFALLNLVPLLSLYILMIRVPNPNVTLELIFFGFVSIGFIIPFVAMRFYSLFAFAVENEKFPTLKEIYKLTEGNILRLLLALFVIFFLMMFSIVNYYLMIKSGSHGMWMELSSEFCYNMLILFLTNLFISHCYLQKLFIFGAKKDETHD